MSTQLQSGAGGAAAHAGAMSGAMHGGAAACEDGRGRARARGFLVAGLALLLACALACVGGTWALASTTAAHEDLAEYFDAKLVEKCGGEPVAAYPGFSVERTAAAQNTGAKTMWVRMSLDKYWMEKVDGAWKRVDDAAFNTDFIVVHTNDAAWTDGGDGWWYCNDPVEPGAASASLLESIEISAETGEEVQGIAETESIYASHAASVDVTMECTAAPDPVPDADSDAAAAAGSATKAKFGQTADIAKSISKPDTGDALPWVLFLAAGAAFVAALVFFVAAWRRRRGRDDDNAQVLEFTL